MSSSSSPVLSARPAVVLMALLATLLLVLGTVPVRADVVELHDGERLEGRFLGATTSLLRFEVRGSVRSIPIADVALVRFDRQRDDDSATAGRHVVGTGTVLRVRLEESLSSNRSRTGDRFRATLLTDLAAPDALLAEAGRPVWGRVVLARRERRPEDHGLLDLELGEVEIENRMRPLKTFKHEVIEAADDGVEARRGEIRLARGSILEFRLAQPLIIRRSRY